MKVLEQVEKGQLLCASSDDLFFEIIGFTSRLDIKITVAKLLLPVFMCFISIVCVDLELIEIITDI